MIQGRPNDFIENHKVNILSDSGDQFSWRTKCMRPRFEWVFFWRNISARIYTPNWKIHAPVTFPRGSQKWLARHYGVMLFPSFLKDGWNALLKASDAFFFRTQQEISKNRTQITSRVGQALPESRGNHQQSFYFWLKFHSSHKARHAPSFFGFHTGF